MAMMRQKGALDRAERIDFGFRASDDLNYVHLVFQHLLSPALGALEDDGASSVNGVGVARPFAELVADVAGLASG
jgi:hypothetical protein